MDAQALVSRAAPEKKRAHDVQYVFWQHELLVDVDVWVGQIDGENGVVVADARAQKQQLFAVEQHLQVREMARVAKENAVRSVSRRADVGMAVEHSEAVAVLQGSAGTCGGSGRRNIERGLRNLLEQWRGRVLPKQWMGSRCWRPCRFPSGAWYAVSTRRRISTTRGANDKR